MNITHKYHMPSTINLRHGKFSDYFSEVDLTCVHNEWPPFDISLGCIHQKGNC